MFDAGQLVWVLSSDGSGAILSNHSPVLIIAKYVGVPRAFLYNDEANDTITGRKEKIVYDILCDGIVEYAVDEDWLGILTDEEVKAWASSSL